MRALTKTDKRLLQERKVWEHMKLTDSDNDKREKEREEGEENLLQKTLTTKVLLGVIAVLLIFILILLTVMVSNRQNRQDEADSDLQQSITDYAKEQQEREEQVIGEGEERPTVEKPASEETEEDEEEESAEEEDVVSADNEKTAIVVDIEDENDEAYTKEFILKEAYPYFADNKQDAIWDLAHLKRYVKLSKGLEGTGDYYYQGDVDSEGNPHGTGLAIYEKNSYYFGEWSHGTRNGKGTWFRFYINQKNKTNAMGIYMSHSYAGNGRTICQTVRVRSTMKWIYLNWRPPRERFCKMWSVPLKTDFTMAICMPTPWITRAMCRSGTALPRTAYLRCGGI